MGVKDSCMSASVVVKIAFVVGLLAIICSWLSFTTPSWTVAENVGGPDIHAGLWRICEDEVTQCISIDGTANISFGAVQAFAILGFVGVNVAFLLTNLFICYGSCKQNAEAGMISGIVFIVAGVTWLVAVVVFGADVYEDNPGIELGYSFFFGCITVLVALIAGILMILGSRGGGSVGSS